MSLIEHLQQDTWPDALRRNFVLALDVLKTDRFRPRSSALDDMKSWLAGGGVSRVKQRLGEQMEQCRFAREKQQAISALLDQLVHQHQAQLLDLMALRIIPFTDQELMAVCGFAAAEFQVAWDRILAGENPFEEWMRAHGHDDAAIARIYQVIDAWLVQQGLRPPLGTDPRTN